MQLRDRRPAAAAQPNLVNNFYLTAIYPNGSTSPPVPLTITHDQQMPSLFIDFPPDGAELTNEGIVVAGRVGDMLSGFDGLDVSVDNDDPAIAPIAAIVNIGVGTNGTYESQGAVPLNLGTNVIKVTAMDILENATVKQITVTRVVIPEGSPQMMAIAGNDQSRQMLTILPEKLVVQVLKADGSPFVNKVVTFNVTQSNGRLYGDTDPDIGGPGSMMLQVHTDANGKARALWRLGTDAGCGNNRVTVTPTSIAGTVFFCASASAAPPSQINIGSGNNQRTEVGGLALEPLRVRVSDGCNGVSGVPITFTVVQGNGQVSAVGAAGGASSATVSTGPTGHAAVDFVLGTQPGNNAVEATWGNNPSMPARFVAYGVQRDLTQPTRFTGLVLDNASQALGNAHVKLTVGTTMVAEAFSESDGRFELNDVPISGPAELLIEGYEVNTVGGETVCNGSYPFLRYAVVVTPNADNSLPSPVLLPKLDPCNQVTYMATPDPQNPGHCITQDVELTIRMSDPDNMPAAPCDPPQCIPAIEGLKMTIKAGTTITRLGGTRVGPNDCGSVALSLNQVHHDDIPMPMPDGAAPPFAWTLQPGGATFDPPLSITYPNMSGLPAGSVAYFLSFNHDTGKFEIIATGHVTPDGSSIETDAGAGLSIAGWGCNCPPYSVTTDCEKCNVFILNTFPRTVPTCYSVLFQARGRPEPGSFTWEAPGGDPAAGTGRLPCAFGFTPGLAEMEKALFVEGFVAIEAGSDQAIAFECSDYYGKTELWFSNAEVDEQSKARVAEAFWNVLLAEPTELADFAAKVYHIGAGVWLEYGCQDGEPYCDQLPEDEEPEVF